MKAVYVAHPLRGDIDKNTAEVTEICRNIALHEPDTLPISPIHALSFLRGMAHHPDEVEEMALAYCFSLLEQCDEVRFYGDWPKSEGCRKELSWARKLGKEVRFMGVQS